MENIYNVYNIIVILWYLVSLFMLLFIYSNCIRRYDSKNEKKKYEKNPKKISNSELSYLMYKNISSEVLTASILDLINRKYLLVDEIDGEYYIKENFGSTSKLSQSDKYLLEIINRIIDGKKSISLTALSNYCNSKKNAKDFLINYEIYTKILRNESTNIPYFETKLIYSKINLYKNISYGLWLMSFVLTFYKYYSILGYLIIIISFLINELFLKSYKRTKEANDLYFDYIAYKNYLNDIDKLGYDNKEINNYIMAGLILKVEEIDQKLEQGTFPLKLNDAVSRCVKKAFNRK